MGVAVGQPKGRLPKTTRDASRWDVGDVRRRPQEYAVMISLFSTSILSFSGFTLDDHGCATGKSAQQVEAYIYIYDVDVIKNTLGASFGPLAPEPSAAYQP